jgi:hypothetical protein
MLVSCRNRIRPKSEFVNVPFPKWVIKKEKEFALVAVGQLILGFSTKRFQS